MIKIKKHFQKFFLLFFAALTIQSSKAQDPHFTQYFAAPMLMNPAFTGFFNGDVRLSGCYRNQWSSIQYPYSTGTISADANAFKGIVNDGDIMGIGFNGLFDKTNFGGLKTNSLSASFSYHKLLDEYGVNRLGVGFMATYNSKILDYSKFVFGNQLTPRGFDPSKATGESDNGFTANYLDYSVGILYSAITDVSGFYAGASVYHFNKPTESFNGPIHEIQPKIVGNVGGNFSVGESNKVFLSAAYMRTDFSNDLIFGFAYSKALTSVAEDNCNLIMGSWYRFNDAISPYVGLEYKTWRGGLSYDINVSKLSSASLFRGGFELTLSYMFTQDENANNMKQTLCPKGNSQLRWFGY